MTIKNETFQVLIITILLLLTFQSFAYEKESSVKSPQKVSIEKVKEDDNFNMIFLEHFLNRNNLAVDKLAIQSTELKYLQANFNAQLAKSDHLEKEILLLKSKLYQIEAKANLGDNSNDIAGVLLTAVAVIVTTLGVIIAVITFIGYKDIVQRAENKAREITVSLINKTANDEMTRLINSGAFESHITQAVDRVVYKDLYADDELTNDDDPSDNKEGKLL